VSQHLFAQSQIAGVALSIFMPAIGSCAEPVSVSDVVKVWAEREKAATTLRVVIATDRQAPTSPSDTTRMNDRRIVTIEDNKMRHERTGKAWIEAAKATAPETMTAVFDGTTSKILNHRARNDDLVHSMGWVFHAATHSDAHSMHLSPVLRHYRPFTASFNPINKVHLKLVRSDDLVNGIPCIVIEEPPDSAKRITQHWVAPSKEMAILRSVITFRGRKHVQVETQFEKSERAGYFPSKWTSTQFTAGGDKAFSSSTNVMSHVDVNIVVTSGTFDLEFPPGTELYDRVAQKLYVITEEGQKREVLESEQARGAKHLELMRTTPGNAAKRE
jgi:hypothetical protein